jgi:putative colanic acid biosynthesis acetyltransferase WcaF
MKEAPVISSERICEVEPTCQEQQPVYQDLSLFVLPKGFRGRSAFTVQLWWIIQDTLFRLSPQALFGWRVFLLRCFGAKLGKNVRIRPTVRVNFPWKLSIGDNVWVGDDCIFYNLAHISLGSNVALAHSVYLCTGLHDYTQVEFPISAQPIRVEDQVWLTNDIFVGPGVTVGRGCVVGTRRGHAKLGSSRLATGDGLLRLPGKTREAPADKKWLALCREPLRRILLSLVRQNVERPRFMQRFSSTLSYTFQP